MWHDSYVFESSSGIQGVKFVGEDGNAASSDGEEKREDEDGTA